MYQGRGRRAFASRSNTFQSYLTCPILHSSPPALRTPQQLDHPLKMSNSLFSQHTRLSEEVFARFMSLPQGDAYQAEYICKSKRREWTSPGTRHARIAAEGCRARHARRGPDIFIIFSVLSYTLSSTTQGLVALAKTCAARPAHSIRSRATPMTCKY